MLIGESYSVKSCDRDLILPDMSQTCMEYMDNMLIFESVVDMFSFSTGLNNMSLFQLS